MYESRHAPLDSADISSFSPETSNFCYIKKYWYRLHFNTQLITFFEPLRVVLINVVAILMMSAKLETLGLLKKKVFWNKGYDVIIFVHDVTNIILLRDSNYIVDAVMRPKFGNSNISLREVTIISVL